ncbi:hydroxyacid dehydrogenase [Aureimonas flava]|nr:hydroxyacid dehydrogenase [Aureimonas flava]
MTDRAPMTVLCTNPVDDYCAATLAAYGPVRVASGQSEDVVSAEIADAVALVVRGSTAITDRILSAAPNLKVIGRTGVGYDSIDIDACTARGIPVVYTPGAGARAVSEATMALFLAMCKKVGFWDQQLKAGNWKSRYDHQNEDLDETTVGIVGFGRIGQMTASMARPFNVRILAFDPGLSDDAIRAAGAEPATLEDLFARSDFIALHCPLIEATRGIVNTELLKGVKRGAYLVNLARGGVIDGFDCLADALDDGRLAGVALDVFDPAPPDVSHRIFSDPRLLSSPHSAATSRGGMTRIFRSMTDDMVAILEGRKPEFVVNPEVL